MAQTDATVHMVYKTIMGDKDSIKNRGYLDPELVFRMDSLKTVRKAQQAALKDSNQNLFTMKGVERLDMFSKSTTTKHNVIFF